jgi:hypothetical protein
MKRPLLLAFLFVCAISSVRAQNLANPILFVTQTPTPDDSATVTALFGNHGASTIDAPRGDALWIRYPDGTLKNLTKAAGYGTSGFQGANAIAVRQPCVSWDGTKALFSMVVGAPDKANDATQFYWQIYEITGLGKTETPVITKISNQPAQFNNVSPIYGTDGRIIFTSDRTITGERHLYPAMDEYKGTHTNTGLWSLDPKTGDVFALDLSPSGDFSPFMDSYGRVLVMRWDRLQRDRNADLDALGTAVKGTFNYTDESAAGTPQFGARDEFFPEPQGSRKDLLNGTNMVGFEFNQFFPWMINEDGSSPEIINHLGRHEMRAGIGRSITDDANVANYDYKTSGRSNQNPLVNLTSVVEDPLHAGLYYGIDAQQFGTHSGGQIVSLTAQPTLDPDQSVVTYVTNRATQAPGSSTAHSGFYRNPIPLSDGNLICAHTAYTLGDQNMGTASNPRSHYDFALKTLKQSNGYYIPDQNLTTGISDSVVYYKGSTLVTYSGKLWELDPVEVRARTMPPHRTYSLSSIEGQLFTDAGVDVSRFKQYLKDKGLAVAVTRDVTHRDAADHQQPYCLRIAGTQKQSANATGKIYDVSHMQFYQGDFVRGNGLTSQSGTPHAGRRVLAQPMHIAANENPDNGGGPSGSVKLADDGSLAAFVPTRRPVTWELLSPTKQSIVRERYWVTYQPGDIRVCASCHGTNDAALNPKNPIPQNAPKALSTLLDAWKSRVMPAHVMLESPANQQTVYPTTVLQWKADTLATAYHLQVASDAQFNTIVFDKDSLLSTHSNFTTAPATTYYWRVTASNKYIDGGWSDTWSFTAEGPQQSVADHIFPVLNLSTYPEPATTGMTVHFELTKDDHPVLMLYDLTGRNLMEYDCGKVSRGEHEAKFDLSLPSGSYVLKLQYEGGSVDKVVHVVR